MTTFKTVDISQKDISKDEWEVSLGASLLIHFDIFRSHPSIYSQAASIFNKKVSMIYHYRPWADSNKTEPATFLILPFCKFCSVHMRNGLSRSISQ